MGEEEKEAATAVSGSRSRRDLLRFLLRGAQNFFSRVVGAVVTYVIQILLARWIGADELGIYLQAFSACLLVTNFALLGLGAAAMRFVVRSLESGRLGEIRGYVLRSRQIVLGSSVIAALGIIAVAWGTLAQPWMGSALVVAGLTLPFYARLRLQADIGHALSWFTFWNLPNNVLRPLLLLAVIAGLHQWASLRGADQVMMAHAVIVIALLLGQTWIFRRGIRGVVGGAAPVAHERAWLRTALPLSLAGTFTAYYGEVNVVAAGFFLNPDELAVFNVTYRTAMFLVFVIMAVDNAQLPRISRMIVAGDKPALRDLLRRGARAKCLGTFGGFVFLAVAGQYILGWFGDARYVAGYGYLMAFAAGFLGRSVIGPAASMLSVSGHQDRCVTVYGIGLLAIAILDMLLIPSFGTAGAVTTVVLVLLACDLTLHWIARKELGIRTDLFAPALSAAAEERTR